MVSQERLVLSDLLFEYEEKYGLFDEQTKAIRYAYLTVCKNEEREEK